MIAKVITGTIDGIEGIPVRVEVDVSNRGFPSFSIVGLPSKAVEEAKERVRSALVNSGYTMPECRVTVNLAPADIPKQGSGLDLPISMGILVASGVIPQEELSNSMIIGELSLDGSVRGVQGMIALAAGARKAGYEQMCIPQDSVPELHLISGISYIPVKTLRQLADHFQGKGVISLCTTSGKLLENSAQSEHNFADVFGQEQAKRALEIAAAGFHNLHMAGPPGAGKTMLARAFCSILPPLSMKEILEVTTIYSVAGLMKYRTHHTEPPIRFPHHTISRFGLVGGGGPPRPGEISLAHRGVLCMDEFPEFSRQTLESLRQPLEDGTVSISRTRGTVQFPCRAILFAASNPCPCGYIGHPTKQCVCTPSEVERYRKKLSGPLLDRIDIHMHVAPVDYEALRQKSSAEPSSTIRERVMAARERQKRRLNTHGVLTNGEMSSAVIRKVCVMETEAEQLLLQAARTMSISARSYYKIIKVAQTIADLDHSDNIKVTHMAESIQYRR